MKQSLSFKRIPADGDYWAGTWVDSLVFLALLLKCRANYWISNKSQVIYHSAMSFFTFCVNHNGHTELLESLMSPMEESSIASATGDQNAGTVWTDTSATTTQKVNNKKLHKISQE